MSVDEQDQPGDEAAQLENTTQHYFTSANQSSAPPQNTYSPPPATLPSPPRPHHNSTTSTTTYDPTTPLPHTIIELSNTTLIPTQPNFQIKGLASNLAPVPTKISRKMQRRLQYEAQTTKGTFVPVPRVRQKRLVHMHVGGENGEDREEGREVEQQQEKSVFHQQQQLQRKNRKETAQMYEVRRQEAEVVSRPVQLQEARRHPVSAWANHQKEEASMYEVQQSRPRSVQEVRQQPVSAWAPPVEKDGFGNASSGF